MGTDKMRGLFNIGQNVFSLISNVLENFSAFYKKGANEICKLKKKNSTQYNMSAEKNSQ